MPPKTGAKLPRWAKLIRPKKQPTSTMTKRQPLTVREEEVYMRKRCFHILSNDMNDAMDHVLEETIAPSLDLIRDYLDAAAPPADLRSSSLSPGKTSASHSMTPVQPRSSRKRQRLFSASTPNPVPNNSNSPESTTETSPSFVLEGLDSQLFDQQQEPHVSHDPLLLPIVLLEGPPFSLDRKAHTDCITTCLRKSRTNSVVVKVAPQRRYGQRGGGGKGSNTSHNSNSNDNSANHWMMQELVRQCHAQIPVLNTESLQRRIVKRKKKKACTYSDMLLLWAQHIACYDEIVIVLDADEHFHSPELQDFLHALAARRSEQGIPLAVVMMGPHDGRRTMELMSTWQGYAGFVIRSVLLPPPSQIVEQFWKQLYLKRQFPVLLPSVVLAAIQRSFIYQQASFCKTVRKLQQALAYHFTQPGSLLSVANDPSILSELWQRLAWFCVAEYSPERVTDSPAKKAAEEAMVGAYCRSILLGDDAEELSSTEILQIFKEGATRQQSSHLVLQLMVLISDAKKSGNKLNVFKPSFLYLLDNLKRQDVLQQLCESRKQVCMGSAAGNEAIFQQQKPSSKDLMIRYVKCTPLKDALSRERNYETQQLLQKVNLLNELIILVGNCRDGDSLSEIEQILDNILGRTHDEPRSLGCWWTDQDWAAIAESFSPEPRQNNVSALLRLQRSPGDVNDGEKDRSIHLSLINVAGTMYRLIHDRVAATQEDWYEEFWQKAIVEAAVEVPREKSFALFSFGLRYLKQCGFISEKLRVGSRSDIIYERALVWMTS